MSEDGPFARIVGAFIVVVFVLICMGVCSWAWMVGA